MKEALRRWQTEVATAWQTRAGRRLAWLFNPAKTMDLPEISASSRPILFQSAALQKSNPDQLAREAQTNPHNAPPALNYPALLAAFVKCCVFAAKKDWPECVIQAQILMDLIIDLLRDANNAWAFLTPALASVCDFAVTAATVADEIPASSDACDEISEAVERNYEEGQSEAQMQQTLLNGIRIHIGKFRSDESNQGAYMILLSTLR